MPRIHVPKNIGECEIITAKAGNFAIWNRKSGKNKFMIPCRDLEQAEKILQKIRKKNHNDELWI